MKKKKKETEAGKTFEKTMAAKILNLLKNINLSINEMQ
jgi:hypothetical protein